jgi:hypothetical protein
MRVLTLSTLSAVICLIASCGGNAKGSGGSGQNASEVQEQPVRLPATEPILTLAELHGEWEGTFTTIPPDGYGNRGLNFTFDEFGNFTGRLDSLRMHGQVWFDVNGQWHGHVTEWYTANIADVPFPFPSNDSPGGTTIHYLTYEEYLLVSQIPYHVESESKTFDFVNLRATLDELSGETTVDMTPSMYAQPTARLFTGFTFHVTRKAPTATN